LSALLAANGYQLPDGASVYAVELPATGGPSGDHVTYQAGGGADASDFWPASSIKVVVAVGALEYLGTMGLTGAATVSTDDGWSSTVQGLYDAAIRDRSNEAYDELVQVAGLDWLNTVFLTGRNGFSHTVVQRSYSGIDVTASPAMTLTEGDRSVSVPPRSSTASYDCPDDGNCSTLLELADTVRRVVLDGELPTGERFGIAATDVAGLTSALLNAGGFIDPGVAAALGPGSLTYDKPGWVSGLDCVDVGLAVQASSGRRFLLGMAVPDDGAGCDVLADIAEHVLDVML
jgi:hypothetical protein